MRVISLDLLLLISDTPSSMVTATTKATTTFTTHTEPASTTQATTQPCINSFPDSHCNYMKGLGFCHGKDQNCMNKKCYKSCSGCHDPTSNVSTSTTTKITTHPSTCENKFSESFCTYLAGMGLCNNGSMEQCMNINCYKTCTDCSNATGKSIF